MGFFLLSQYGNNFYEGESLYKVLVFVLIPTTVRITAMYMYINLCVEYKREIKCAFCWLVCI